MRLQFVEHRDVGRGDAFNRLRQQIGSQLVRDRLADQPECVLGQPSRGTRLVEFQLVLNQMTQSADQVMLQRMNRRLQRLVRVATDVLCGGDSVSLNHQFAQHAGTFVLTGQDIQQAGP
ncbi:hypothetical protein D3C81_1337010 [compost metagenome]